MNNLWFDPDSYRGRRGSLLKRPDSVKSQVFLYSYNCAFQTHFFRFKIHFSMVNSSFCVYIIFSEKLNGYYVGTTNDFSKRLKEHNDKAYEHSYTSRGAPWQPYLIIEVLQSEQAYKIEKHIKKMRSLWVCFYSLLSEM